MNTTRETRQGGFHHIEVHFKIFSQQPVSIWTQFKAQKDKNDKEQVISYPWFSSELVMQDTNGNNSTNITEEITNMFIICLQ